MTYNEQAQQVLDLAKEEALALNHNYIGTEHLLLGLLREGSATTELVNLGVTLETVRKGVVFIIGRGEGSPSSEPGLTPRTREVLKLAGAEAQRLGETAISPYHILVGILREGEGIAAKLIVSLGVRVEWVGDTPQLSNPPETDEGPVTVPADFQAALEQHPAAHSVFGKLSSSKQKTFIDGIEQTEGEDARSLRIGKAIEYLEKIANYRP